MVTAVESRTMNDQEPVSSQSTAAPSPNSHKGGSRSILVAALVGLSMALDWENRREEPTIVAEAPGGQDWLDLDVGGLEPLDPNDDL